MNINRREAIMASLGALASAALPASDANGQQESPLFDTTKFIADFDREIMAATKVIQGDAVKIGGENAGAFFHDEAIEAATVIVSTAQSLGFDWSIETVTKEVPVTELLALTE